MLLLRPRRFWRSSSVLPRRDDVPLDLCFSSELVPSLFVLRLRPRLILRSSSLSLLVLETLLPLRSRRSFRSTSDDFPSFLELPFLDSSLVIESLVLETARRCLAGDLLPPLSSSLDRTLLLERSYLLGLCGALRLPFRSGVVLLPRSRLDLDGEERRSLTREVLRSRLRSEILGSLLELLARDTLLCRLPRSSSSSLPPLTREFDLACLPVAPYMLTRIPFPCAGMLFVACNFGRERVPDDAAVMFIPLPKL